MKHPDVRPLDYHTMTQTPRGNIADAAFGALSGVQKRPPEEIMLGLAVAFAAMCSRTCLDPAEMHSMALRVLRSEPHHKRANDSLQSLQDFAGLRVMGQDVSVS